MGLKGTDGKDPGRLVEQVGSSGRAEFATLEETKEQPVEAQSTGAPAPKLAPRTFALPKVGQAEKAVEAGYEEHLERLEEIIEEQAEEVAAEVARVAEEKGLEPEDVTLVASYDITGKDELKCVFCGRPTCSFRPQVYRVKNPEVDLLGDAITVFQEAASRAGAKYAMIVYDDQDVLVLREPEAPEDQAERGTTLARYAAFRDRLEYPDPNSRAWMDQMLAKWTPDQANTSRTGAPLDKKMFEVLFNVFDTAGGEIRAAMVSKSIAPKMSMRGVEVKAKKGSIAMTGVAVGRDAEYVAPRLFKNTVVAPDLHELREKVGEAINESMKQIEEAKE